MKANKPFWELGLNPITMTKYESISNINHHKTPLVEMNVYREKWNDKYSKR